MDTMLEAEAYGGGESLSTNYHHNTPKVSLVGIIRAKPTLIPYPEPRTQPRPQRDSVVKLND